MSRKRGRSNPILRSLVRLVLLVPVAFAAPACRSADVAEYSLATPELALDSFKRANAADNYEYEYKSLSSGLKRDLDLSYNTYTLGRGTFLRQHRDRVKLFLRSEIARVVYSPDRKTARVDLTAGEEVGEIVLVNEPYFEWIVDDGSGRGVETKGSLAVDVPSVVRVVDDRIVADVPLDGVAPPEGEVALFRVTRAWKFSQLLNIREFRFDEAAERAKENDGEKPGESDEP